MTATEDNSVWSQAQPRPSLPRAQPGTQPGRTSREQLKRGRPPSLRPSAGPCRQCDGDVGNVGWPCRQCDGDVGNVGWPCRQCDGDVGNVGWPCRQWSPFSLLWSQAAHPSGSAKRPPTRIRRPLVQAHRQCIQTCSEPGFLVNPIDKIPKIQPEIWSSRRHCRNKSRDPSSTSSSDIIDVRSRHRQPRALV